MKVWTKTNILILINIFILIAGLSYILLWGTPQQLAVYQRAVEDWRERGEYGRVVVNATWWYFNTTDILNYSMNEFWWISPLVVKVSVADIPIDVYDMNLNHIATTKTNQTGIAIIDATSDMKADYYVKATFNVHFLEGGKETYFFWAIFTLKHDNPEIFTWSVILQHALWEERPSSIIQDR